MKLYLYAGPKALIMTPKMDMFPAPWSFSRALSKCLSHCGTILAARLRAFKTKVNWSQSYFWPKIFERNFVPKQLIQKDEAGCFNLWALDLYLKFLKNFAAVIHTEKKEDRIQQNEKSSTFFCVRLLLRSEFCQSCRRQQSSWRIPKKIRSHLFSPIGIRYSCRIFNADGFG